MIKKSIINIITVFILFGVFQISNYVGNLASAHFPNLAVTYAVYTLVYIGVALLMGIVYAKIVLKMSLKDIGIRTRFPEWIWWGMGIVLPGVVSLFYLCFVEGKLCKTGTINFTVIVFTICVGFSAGVVEEFLFRGILFRYMKETWGVGMAVIVPSVLFALLHVRNLNNPNMKDVTLLMLSGTFGIEAAVPAIITYLGAILVIIYLRKKKRNNKG